MSPVHRKAVPPADAVAKLAVTVSVLSRFHAFDLAQQLQHAGVLARLITTYPKFIARRWEVPPKKVSSVLPLEILLRAWNKGPFPGRWQSHAQLWFCEQFDRAASRRLRADSNFFVGWSSFSLRAIRKAKSLGMKTVVERCSSHIVFQTEILREEYRRWGLDFTATPESIIDREVQEYEEADRVAVPSLFARQTFLDRGYAPDKLLHVPYGVSLQEFFPVRREDDIFRVVYCGTLTLRKGLPYLLQAFHELNLPKAELWLVGAVTAEALPVLARYQSDKIVAKGAHPQSRLRWFYSQSSVFCLPSIEEGFGMVIPQAMACGLPVICSTNTGGRDIMDQGVEGFEVPIRDVEAIKEKILYLYENPEARQAMGERARQRAVTALTWKQYGTKVLAAYRRMLGADPFPA